MRLATRTFAVVAALAAAWGASLWLKPLAGMVPMTREMLATTREILAETKSLQIGVGEVQYGLRGLQRQEKLLEEQEQLTRSLLSELRRQQELGQGATARLREILAVERTTVELTRQADQASAATLETVRANAAELERLTAATARVEGTSRTMDGQMDRLLVELEGSADNFAVVEKLRQAADQAADRSTNWWDRLWEWMPWKKH